MKRAFITLFLCAAFIALVITGFIFYEYLKPAPVADGSVESLTKYLITNFKEGEAGKRFGCAGLVLVQEGEISLARCFGNPRPGAACDPQTTLFTVASVSKAVSALGVMALVQDGEVDLDESALPYMKRWKFPGTNPVYARTVSLRHLLSHTAGIHDGFGTGGVVLTDTLQALPEYLNYPLNTNHGEPHPTVVSNLPGTSFAYSTMGYAVLQLFMEDKTGLPFNEFMVDSVFTPLGITQSSYDIEQIVARGDEADLVSNYDESLKIQPYNKYSSQAGAALRLTVMDLARIICALGHNALVSDSLLRSMYQPQPGTYGSWGLGLELYGERHSIVGHGGGAFPRSGASFRFNPETGNGIGIMMAGGSEMIDPYIATWQYWETGEKQFDIRQVYHAHSWHALIVSTAGILAISFLRRRRVS